jgi:hypothetical protein
MHYLVTIAHQVWHLFVDDAVFAAAIVAWPALIWLAVRLGVPSFLAPEVLSIGYGIILYLGAIERAYRDKPKDVNQAAILMNHATALVERTSRS